MTDCDRLLALLSDGKAHSRLDIQNDLSLCAVTHRISDLRKRGHRIVCIEGPRVGYKRRTAYRLEAKV